MQLNLWAATSYIFQLKTLKTKKKSIFAKTINPDESMGRNESDFLSLCICFVTTTTTTALNTNAIFPEGKQSIHKFMD